MGYKIINPILDLQKNYKKMIFLNSFVFNDSDANAFLDVARPYDNTKNELAITNWIKNYKLACGVYRLSDTGDKAIYLMYGATETACCLNLINPSLTNAYNLTKFGTPIFSANGVATSGTQYLNTHVNPYFHTVLNNVSLMSYERVNSNAQAAIGIFADNLHSLFLSPRFTNNKEILNCYSINENVGKISSVGNVTVSTGLSIGNRTASNNANIWLRGSKLNTLASTEGSMPNAQIIIGGYSSGALRPNTYCFNMVGSGKTDAQCIAITNAVNQLQTDLGRAV
jgi:hypothetical protein